MNNRYFVELIGYMGTVLVAASMLMSSMKKLRILNLLGSGIFVIYALLIHSYPTVGTNLFLTGVNLFYLMRMRFTERHFELVNTGKDSATLDYFLSYYQDNIQKSFPEFRKDITVFDTAYMVFCDCIPAGVILGNLDEEGTLDTVLDYATPAYRDFSVGRFLYERLPERGVFRLVLRVPTVDFEPYMKKMGFHKEDKAYVCEL